MVVAKKPAPGTTKTRLCPPLNGLQAAALYEAFLLDTLALIRSASQQIPFDPFIVFLPSDADGYFRSLAPDFGRFEQVGENLSERLNHATTHCLTILNYDQVAIMDSDSPTLPTASLLEAFTTLEKYDVSLGPTEDGGYYLIGLKQPAPSLFLSITMSTPHVAQETCEQALAAGLSLHLLPRSYDVDYIEDLRRLVNELPQLPAHIAANTRRFLSERPDLLKG